MGVLSHPAAALRLHLLGTTGWTGSDARTDIALHLPVPKDFVEARTWVFLAVGYHARAQISAQSLWGRVSLGTKQRPCRVDA